MKPSERPKKEQTRVEHSGGFEGVFMLLEQGLGGWQCLVLHSKHPDEQPGTLITVSIGWLYTTTSEL